MPKVSFQFGLAGVLVVIFSAASLFPFVAVPKALLSTWRKTEAASAFAFVPRPRFDEYARCPAWWVAVSNSTWVLCSWTTWYHCQAYSWCISGGGTIMLMVATTCERCFVWEVSRENATSFLPN